MLSKMVVVAVLAILVVTAAISVANLGSEEEPVKQEVVDQEVVSTEPVITTKTITETEAIPFEKTSVDYNSLNKGITKIKTIGVDGERTKTYKITLTDGVETSRELVSEETTKQPVHEVTTIGTYVYVAPKPDPAPITKEPTSSCDPNYSGACVPIASDVDCAGGSGNGPAYVKGPVTVIGKDIYGLDGDNNGIGCES